MDDNRKNESRRIKWVYNLSGPILSLIAFLTAYYIDPLNFGRQQPLSALPAFLLSIVILIITQNISTNYEIDKANQYSDKIYEAIKDYVHVISIGSPQHALEYILTRLSSIREVKNTSFNVEDEVDRSDEKYYDTKTYGDAIKQIALFCTKNLIWKDIGDSKALPRLRLISQCAHTLAKKEKHYYKYKLISHNEPQINFIILEFEDGCKEVLFNWDFRGLGQDPTVLISRDLKIVEMFTVHFNLLWRKASMDHDNIAVRSTS